MTFVLSCFRTFGNVRQFYFEAVGADRSRLEVTVGVDLNLIRRYGITLQELPLLCWRLLEERAAINPIVVTEAHVAQYANARTAKKDAQMEKRKKHRGAGASEVASLLHRWPAPNGGK